MPDRQKQAETIANNAGFQQEYVDSNQFKLKIFHKGVDSTAERLVVYIEGDGFAWKKKGILSADPTPKDPVSLKLASRDPRMHILYIARPCQYLELSDLQNCSPRYWSSHRYSDEVIISINRVIDHFVHLAGANEVELIGYSGGGSVAALVASRRTDVNSLVTIVGNLDHVKWTELHDVSPLTGSLNAADIAENIQHIKQFHFSGVNDVIVPVSILESYLKRMTNTSNTRVKQIQGFNHDCCWLDSWPDLLCSTDTIEQDYCN